MKISTSPSSKRPTDCCKRRTDKSLSSLDGFGRIGWGGCSLHLFLLPPALGVLTKTMLHPLVLAF